MNIDETVNILSENKKVAEFYVFIREIKLFLDIGHDFFHPEIKIKIYQSPVINGYPYHFTVSHYVHTPIQASPYHPSRSFAQTEEEAISQAISTTATFLEDAISQGFEPEDDWLVLNKRF
ncbi:TPA: hypothetical protein PC598_000398 [Morganella morganii]|nr:hypothetical protein [Morganella morganii]